ncbi:hypothetical protein AMECASPLE_036797 [Ameca splendens]|uniref:Uncharacterized protein n=1 Tax=Ameca splendens TaxID=208324 RepID=A0ABV0ZHS6_9TELE
MTNHMIQNETHPIFLLYSICGGRKVNILHDDSIFCNIFPALQKHNGGGDGEQRFTLLGAHFTVQTLTDRNIYISKVFIWTYYQFEAHQSFPLLEGAKCLLCSSHFPKRTEED